MQRRSRQRVERALPPRTAHTKGEASELALQSEAVSLWLWLWLWLWLELELGLWLWLWL